MKGHKFHRCLDCKNLDYTAKARACRECKSSNVQPLYIRAFLGKDSKIVLPQNASEI